jgi:hypothetical protein
MNNRAKLIAFQTIATKEILRFARIWVQTVLPPVITTALYFIIFGNLIGPRIGEMEGFGYMEFIIPGLIMMAVITRARPDRGNCRHRGLATVQPAQHPQPAGHVQHDPADCHTVLAGGAHQRRVREQF